MTDDFSTDLDSIIASLPIDTAGFAELKALINRLPAPQSPDIISARAGVTPDQSIGTSNFGSTNSTLAGNDPGSDSGAAIGVLPQIFYGKSNLISDPMFWNMGSISPITNVFGPLVGSWRVKYILNSGLLPTLLFMGGFTNVDDPGNTTGSDLPEILVGPGAGACDVSILMQSTTSIATVSSAAYMLGAVRLALYDTNTLTNITSATVTMELVDAGGVIKAASTAFDWKAFVTGASVGKQARLVAAYATAAGALNLIWQIRIRLVATGGGGQIAVHPGEPQQVHSATEQPPPFSPVIAAWVPKKVSAAGDGSLGTFITSQLITDTQARFSVRTDGSHQWGSGAASIDVRLQRSAANILRFDDNASGRASLEGVAGVAPGTPGAGFGRLYYSSATKTWHGLDDAGVDTDLAGGGGGLTGGVPALVFTTANAAGVAVTGIRTDASIAIFDATVPVTQAFADAAAVGAAAFAARRDHKHGMPSFATNAILLGTAAAAGAATTPHRSNDTIAAFDVTAPVTQAFADAAAVGVINFAARRDHKHGMPAAPTAASVGASANPHGAADHTDITRKLFLTAAVAKLDVATAANLGASANLLGVVAYADAATQGAFWTFEVPSDWASGVITIQPVWAPGASDAVAHTVRWSMTCKTLAAGVTVTAAGTTVLFTGASAARTVSVLVYDTATSTTLTPAAAGDLFMIELQRIGADAADTYVGVVNLVGIIVSYTANQ